MNNLIIFSVLASLCIGLSNGFHTLGGESTVIVRNELEHDKLLKVHCSSKDDDLGDKYLKIGEEWNFSFCDNFWGTTKFWCTFDQGPNFRHHEEFVAYKAFWSIAPEAKAQWIAREDGIYFSLDGAIPTKRYEWDGPTL